MKILCTYDLFPFSKIPPRSDIVLFGGGDVGWQYCEQVNSTQYCNIKYIVDNNWENVTRPFPVAVYGIERLKQEDALIVIANALPEQRETMRRQLKDYNIAEERIICDNRQLIAEKESGKAGNLKEYSLISMWSFLCTYDLFPFSKVPLHSEIVLFGGGNVGWQYCEQVNSTQYCNIKYIVDNNWENVTRPFPVAVYGVERLKQEDALIVIANAMPEQQEMMRQQLKDYKIAEERIICDNRQLDAEMSPGKEFLLETFRRIYPELKIRKPKGYSLIRMGNYVMLDHFEGKVAYSFGIGSDVSWDSAIAAKGYDVFMYDHTINALPYEDEKFHYHKRGIADSYACDKVLGTLEEFITENGHEKTDKMILKIDVEGAEWGALCMVPSSLLERFDQIVMEIHELDLIWKTELRKFVLEKLSHTHSVIHVHYCNYSPTFYADNIPLTHAMEVTYVNKKNYQLEDADVCLPLEIDRPCNPEESEIKLGHWNNFNM